MTRSTLSEDAVAVLAKMLVATGGAKAMTEFVESFDALSVADRKALREHCSKAGDRMDAEMRRIRRKVRR